MQGYLVDAAWSWCGKKHIRLAYSETIGDVGRFSLRKVLHLFSVVLAVWRERVNSPIDILYYPPAGPHRIPFYRDLLTLVLIRWCARRLVLHFHAGGFDQLEHMISPWMRRMAIRAYGNSDAAVVLLPSLRNEVNWISPKRIEVVPNGIEDASRLVTRQVGSGVPRILSVGSMSEAKGIFVTLEACRILREQGSEFVFVAIGDFVDETTRTKVTAVIRESGLDSCVVLAGTKSSNEKWQEYANADVFCFPSYETEGQPVVLLEAMQFSLAIVATRWRAIPDLIEDGKEGILIPPEDPVALAEKLKVLLSSPDTRRQMGSTARKKFLAEFTLEEHLNKMERVFHSAAEGM